MSDVSMEQKLQLVQQIRSRYHENQFDLSNRERILYGKTEEVENTVDEKPVSFFKLRFFVAVFLLIGLIVMDKKNINVAGITADSVATVISADYEDKIEELVATFYNVPVK